MRSNRRTFVFATAGVMAAAYGGRIATAGAQDASSTPPGEVANELIVYGDIVQGAKNIPEDQQADRSCVLSSRFPRNSEIVWRVRVIDPETRGAMDDTMLDKVEVALSDGQVFAMHFGPHPGPPRPAQDYYWTVSWVIPVDYPTGTLNYTVTATDPQGRTGQFTPFPIAPSLPTITDEVLEEIPE
jgi:hypothetical protein